MSKTSEAGGLRSEIRALTGLRGVAAMLVAAYHVSVGGGQAHGLAGQFLARGYLWVDMFFVLSGFVLGARYGRLRWGSGTRGYLAFLWRRLARIYPLYAVTTLAMWAAFRSGWTWWQPSYSEPWRTLAASLLLVQQFGLGININPAAWSIGAEWLAYLIYPALAWAALCETRAAPVALLTAAAGALCWIQFAAGPVPAWHRGPLDVSETDSVLPIMRCISEFCLGLLVCRVGASAQAVRARFRGAAIGAFSVCAMALGSPDLLIAALFPALVYALLAPTDLFGRLLAASIPRWFGLISYAVYLVHLPLTALRPSISGQSWLAAHLPASLRMLGELPLQAMMYAAIIAVAWCVHIAIERPARSWMQRYRPFDARMLSLQRRPIG